MAIATATQLTRLHRLAQVRIGARTVQQMIAAFPTLDPGDLDGTFAGWVDVVQTIVDTNRAKSADLAVNYLTTLRTLAIGVGEVFTPIPAGAVDLKALTTSLLVTGPISIRSNLARMIPFDKAIDIAEGFSAGAAMRHALNGGRDTIMQTVKADPRSGRWQRVTSGNSCDFCSMLEDRGAVYSEDTADFEAHDGCACTAEPLYS